MTKQLNGVFWPQNVTTNKTTNRREKILGAREEWSAGLRGGLGRRGKKVIHSIAYKCVCNNGSFLCVVFYFFGAVVVAALVFLLMKSRTLFQMGRSGDFSVFVNANMAMVNTPLIAKNTASSSCICTRVPFLSLVHR